MLLQEKHILVYSIIENIIHSNYSNVVMFITENFMILLYAFDRWKASFAKKWKENDQIFHGQIQIPLVTNMYVLLQFIELFPSIRFESLLKFAVFFDSFVKWNVFL